MRIVPVPCLKDNYAYLVICDITGRAVIVDPGESAPVLAAVATAGVDLTAVWATHHHPDHVGGLPDLVRQRPDLEVVAHDSDQHRIPEITHPVGDGDRVTLGSLSARIVHNPGHTTGAISYWLDGDDGAVFTGDTLFGAGCGRLFEGTATDMHRSLSRLTELPAGTRVYFGHEYTASNLRFAAAVEPDNAAVADRARAVDETRANGRPTTPSTVADERATNPFVRVAEPSVRAAARRVAPDVDELDPVAVLAAIRRWKDTFR